MQLKYTKLLEKHQAVAEQYLSTLHASYSLWLDRLSAHEFLTLQFLLQRTIRYGKRGERIPMRQFAQGLSATDGERLIGKLPVSENTLYKALDTLESHGVLRRHRDYYPGTKVEKGSSIFEIDYKLIQKGCPEMAQLKLGKAHKGGSTVTPPPPSVLPHITVEDCNSRSKTSLGAVAPRVTRARTRTATTPPMPSVIRAPRRPRAAPVAPQIEASAQEVIARVSANAKQRAATNQAKAKAGTLTRITFNAVWLQAIRDTYPDTPAIGATDRDIGILRKAMKENALNVPLDRFLRHLVSAWPQMYAEYTKAADAGYFRQRPTKYPDAAFVCKMYRYMLRDYAKWNHSSAPAPVVAPADNGLIHTLKAEAATSKAAVAEVEAKLAAATSHIAQLGREARENKRKADAATALMRRYVPAADLNDSTPLPAWD